MYGGQKAPEIILVKVYMKIFDKRKQIKFGSVLDVP